MSFFDDASLAFLPSSGAGKDGKAYSIKPTTGAGDFTFSRGSNLAATRVGPTGLIEKGRENLFLRSNEFDTSPWASSVTLTSGQSGYDGSSDAWLLTKTASGVQSVYNYISQTGVATMSVYAKAGSVHWMRLTHGGKTAYFDLSGSGAVGTSSNGIDQTITSVGNGWFRCTLTANRTAAGQTPIYPYTAEGDASGSTDSIYIQDAQLEIGLAATDYIESGATTGKAGLLEDEPRLDYSGGATCPSLLLEPSRTNIWEYSEYLDYSFAQVTNVTITQNTTETLSPEGLYNATKLEGVGAWVFKDFLSGTNTGTYTISCYVKAVNPSSNNTFRLTASGNNFSSNLTATSEWQRFEFSVTDGGATNSGLQCNSLAEDADLYIYGLQLEEGSYPTSYIPNHSGGSVTRGADACNSAGDSSTFNDSEGVLYVEIAALANDGTNRRIVISDGTFQNNVQLYYYSFPNRVRTLVNSGGITSIDATAAISDATIYHKIAIRYKTNDFSLWVDGVQVATDTSGNTPSGLNQLNFNDAGGSNFYGKAKQVLYFPTALSDTDLATLTTL